MKRIALFFIGIVIVGIGIWWYQQKPEPSMQDDSLTPAAQSLPPQAGDTVVTLETTFGKIKFKLFPQFTPETSKNFSELVKRGFYNGLIFHRVINNFMIQGGDPLGNGTGGETYLGPGTTLPDEISLLRHSRGAVSMANRGPNTGSSQFFIVQAPGGTPWLDSKHTVFGQMFEGFDVLDAIAKTEVDALDRPVSPVKIITATVEIKE